jgi:hypothetical protein
MVGCRPVDCEHVGALCCTRWDMPHGWMTVRRLRHSLHGTRTALPMRVPKSVQVTRSLVLA